MTHEPWRVLKWDELRKITNESYSMTHTICRKTMSLTLICVRVFSNNFKILGGPEKGRLKEFKDFMKFQSLKTLEAYPGGRQLEARETSLPVEHFVF